MRRSIIIPLLFAVSEQALASARTPVWDRSNTLACTVVSAEICRYAGGTRTCTPAQASFDSVKIDYGKSQVNLLATGNLQEAWTIIGVSRGARGAAAVQLLRLQRQMQSTEIVLQETGLLRFVVQRRDGDLTVEARCRPR